MIEGYESAVHLALCKYIRIKYPYVLFNSDLSGFYLGSAPSVAHPAYKKHYKAIKTSRLLRRMSGFPDCSIFLPKNGYYGLFIEIKTEQASPFKKSGGLKVSYQMGGANYNQILWQEALNKLGYKAVFGVGIDECMRIVDEYIIN